MRALLIAVLPIIFIGITSAIECPADQYPYGSCTSCFSVIDQPSTLNIALQICQENGGTLVSIENPAQFELLSHYLEGLVEERQLWIGYRYNNEGVRISVDGRHVSTVVQNDANFEGDTIGNSGTCITIQGSRLVNVACSQSRAFMCQYTYGVPDVALSPEERIVYVPLQQSNFTLSATVSAPEASTLTAIWRFNGSPVSPDQNGYMVTAENGASPSQQIFSLVISTFDPLANSGTYELLVTGLTGTAVSATWQLQEAVLGDITIQPQDLAVPLGSIAGFECAAENATPVPTVTWYRNSIRLDVAGRSRHYVSDVTGTLFIRDLGSDDTGLYHCVVENGGGSATSRMAELTMTNIVSEASIFIQPRPLTILVGQPYSLECVGALESIVDVSYKFFFNTTLIFTTPNAMFVYLDEPGFPVFRIESVSMDNSTNATRCALASRDFSTVETSELASLTVHSPAEITMLSTVVQNGAATESKIIPVPSGSSVIIQCQFTGIPFPTTVEWTQDGQLINMGVVTEGGVSTLSVESVTSGGVYQCHVGNVYGRDSETLVICVEEEESLPGPVLFTAEPNTNTTLYISWQLPAILSTHPLLLRYEVKVQSEESESEVIFNPPAGVTQFVASGLLPGELYRVYVVAKSLLGRGELLEEEVLVRTYGNPITEAVSGLTAQRTADNLAIVVQWSPFPTATPAPILPTYEVQYRLAGDFVLTSMSVMGENVLAIEGITNAADYEVRIRVLTQTQRDPPQFTPGPWSAFLPVTGITTLPPQELGTQGTVPLNGLLLIAILVPVGVLLVLALIVILVVICCCYKRNIKKNAYFPAKIERQNGWSADSTQRSLGSQVYNLPSNHHSDQVWVENNSYAPLSTGPQLTASTDNPTIPTLKQNVSTPANSTVATPAMSVRSGTVTITYLNQNSSASPSPIPDPLPPTPEPESNPSRPKSEANLATSLNGASANPTKPSRPHTWTPASIQATSTTSLTPPSATDPFGYVYKEATSAASDLYKIAMSIEADADAQTRQLSNSEIRQLSTSQASQLSDEYDSLEPELKEDLDSGYGVGCVISDPNKLDFQVLEELAAESAAMASQSGTTDPYAYPPTTTPDF